MDIRALSNPACVRPARSLLCPCIPTARWGTGWGESGFFRMRGDCPYPGALGIYKDTLNNVPLRA
jgi:hypothetical protein